MALTGALPTIGERSAPRRPETGGARPGAVKPLPLVRTMSRLWTGSYGRKSSRLSTSQASATSSRSSMSITTGSSPRSKSPSGAQRGRLVSAIRSKTPGTHSRTKGSLHFGKSTIHRLRPSTGRSGIDTERLERLSQPRSTTPLAPKIGSKFEKLEQTRRKHTDRPERSIEALKRNGDAPVKRVRVKPNRPFNNYKKFQKMAAKTKNQYYSVVNDGAPFMSAEEKRLAEEKESRRHFVGGAFKAAVGVATTGLRVAKPCVAASGEYVPPVSHRFREEDKTTFVAASTFRTDGRVRLFDSTLPSV